MCESTFQSCWWHGRYMSSPLPWVHLWSWIYSSQDERHGPEFIGFTHSALCCPLFPTPFCEFWPPSAREHHLPGHMVISGSHGHFQESLTVEEVKGCSSEGQTTDISPLWEMRPRPGRAFQRFRSQPLSPPNHILKHFYYQEGSACKFQILPLQGMLELWHERKSRETG